MNIDIVRHRGIEAHRDIFGASVLLVKDDKIVKRLIANGLNTEEDIKRCLDIYLDKEG